MNSSTSPQRKLFVTTALPYANGPLHLGHLLEYIQADVWVRAQRMAGHSVQFVCADDAHGAPIMLAAEKAGIAPEEFVARIAAGRKEYLDGFEIHFDNWHSTHSRENEHLAQQIYERLRDRGMIESRSIEQFFDPVKGMFLPDRYIKGECPVCHAVDQYGDSCDVCGSVYAPTELIDPYSALTGARPELRPSKHLFFTLSRPNAVGFLKDWISRGHLQPEVARKTSEWFDVGLDDWDISRDAPYFGIPIPGESGKFFYVWLDAPIGYLASLKNHIERGQARQHWHLPSRTAQGFEEFLADPALEQVHFIGKDILYFHTLFWPCMLHFSGIFPALSVYVHGHLTVNGEKMSKSRGNGINPLRYLALGLDPDFIRYYFAAKLNGRVEDIDFNPADFVSRVNSDLVGKYVNIASRSAGFIRKGTGRLVLPDAEGREIVANLQDFVARAAQAFDAREFARCMRETMAAADRVNEYFDRNKPWELARDPQGAERAQAVCSTCIEAFRLLTICLKPVVPGLTARAEAFLGVEELSFASGSAVMGAGHPLNEYRHLLRRAEAAVLAEAFEAPATA